MKLLILLSSILLVVAEEITTTGPLHTAQVQLNPLLPIDHIKNLKIKPQNAAAKMAQCDQALYKKCGTAYGKLLGFPNGTIPRNPVAFMKHLISLMQSLGVQGFIEICRAGSIFFSCMGGQAGYSACVSVPNLVSYGLSFADATMYVAISTQLAYYECGPGFPIILNNFACLINTAVQQSATLIQCATTYHNAVSKDPAHTCLYVQHYVQCYTAPFRDACNRAAAFSICASMDALFHVLHPACPILCNGVLKVDAKSPEPPMSSPFYFLSQLPKTTNDIDKKVDMAACNMQLFLSCGGNYAKALGISSGHFPTDPMVFLGVLNSIIEKRGLDGFVLICRAANAFRNCMGNESVYSACVNVPNLVNLGLSLSSASMYLAIERQMTYQCGAGYQIIVNNFQCMVQAGIQESTSLRACITAYNTGLKQHPSQACSVTQQFAQCYSTPFKNACGPAPSFVVCSTIKVGLGQSLPLCQISCGLSGFTAATLISRQLIDAASKHAAIEQMKNTTQQPALCNNQTFMTCLNAYSSGFGVSKLPKDPQKFYEIVDQFLGKGEPQQQFEAFCKNNHHLDLCLGPQEDTCLSQQHLMFLGLNWVEAKQYVATHHQFTYQCGTAYNVFKENAKCVVDSMKTLKPVLGKCMATLIKALGTSETPEKICQSAQSFLTCYSAPFYPICNKEAGQALCETVAISLRDFWPRCNYTCPQN